MFKASSEILDILKCKSCNRVISFPPIYIIEDDYICCWCIHFYTKNQGQQFGLEYFLSNLAFICKYCKNSFQWIFIREHEGNCDKSGRILNRIPSNTSDVLLPLLESKDTEESEEESKYSHGLVIKKNFSMKGNISTKKLTVLKYNFEVKGDNLCVHNNGEHRNVKLAIDGAVTVRKEPTSILCNIKVIPLGNYKPKSNRESNIYEEINSNEPIPILTKCKNWGCAWKGLNYELNIHEKECTNAQIFCVFNDCDWNSAEILLKSHFAQKHPDFAITSDSVEKFFCKSDEIWIMFAHAKIFLCKYYRYDEYVEILVELYAQFDENSYFYTVEKISPNPSENKKMTKTCALFNKSVLDEGVRFKINEISLKKFGSKFKLSISGP